MRYVALEGEFNIGTTIMLRKGVGLRGTRMGSAVLVPKKGLSPVIVGTGVYDVRCGNCGTLIIKGMDEGQVRDLIIVCPKCGRRVRV